MPRISFRRQNVPDAFRDRARLRKWLMNVAREHGHSISELTYVLMSDAALLAYNRRYLGHDEYTDVITFDLNTGTGVSGDVLMSMDRIRENAAHFHVPISEELRRVMVHGLLHLLGHTDKSRVQREEMRRLEDRYLALYRS